VIHRNQVLKCVEVRNTAEVPHVVRRNRVTLTRDSPKCRHSGAMSQQRHSSVTAATSSAFDALARAAAWSEGCQSRVPQTAPMRWLGRAPCTRLGNEPASSSTAHRCSAAVTHTMHTHKQTTTVPPAPAQSRPREPPAEVAQGPPQTWRAPSRQVTAGSASGTEAGSSTLAVRMQPPAAESTPRRWRTRPRPAARRCWLRARMTLR
jgi:hypothetical protein